MCTPVERPRRLSRGPVAGQWGRAGILLFMSVILGGAVGAFALLGKTPPKPPSPRVDSQSVEVRVDPAPKSFPEMLKPSAAPAPPPPVRVSDPSLKHIFDKYGVPSPRKEK